MKVGIVRFPGSNCDVDMARAITQGIGQESTYLWHKSHDLQGSDVVVLPGGFSYGDHLRAGAIARFSPIMKEVIEHAREGGLTLGVCNGFQILCEARLLPGALVRNRGLRFRCHDVTLKVENSDTAFTSDYTTGRILEVPIAHGEGQFVADEKTLAELEVEDRVVFRYTDERGEPTDEANPNGSEHNIAGIINAGGNVLGLMPHPERVSLAALGGTDGLGLFRSLLKTVAAPGAGSGRAPVAPEGGSPSPTSTREETAGPTRDEPLAGVGR